MKLMIDGDCIFFGIQTRFFCVADTLTQEEFRERKQELDRKLERVGSLRNVEKPAITVCFLVPVPMLNSKQTDLFMFGEKLLGTGS